MSDAYQLTGRDEDKWVELNPVLAVGEIGYERGTGLFKIGNGVSTWLQLSYSEITPDVPISVVESIVENIHAHVVDESPHPVYDDGPSLILLYENAKV